MQAILLKTAVIIGAVTSLISSVSISSSKSSECLALINTCISDLCRNEHVFLSSVCDYDEGCQIKDYKVCNMTSQSILDQFPSLQGCMCAWEAELCSSLLTLAAQCHQTPALQKRRPSVMDWQSSNLIGHVYDSAGSCLEQMKICIQDEICNRHLLPLIQTCAVEQCSSTNCHQLTQETYGGMPYNVAEMLVMCQCEPWDQDCLYMKRTLHSSSCGDEDRACQEGVTHCLGELHCRGRLKAFQSKCWKAEDIHCDIDQKDDECLSQMDPALILADDVECIKAFVGTMGTAVQFPCSCRGQYDEDLRKCNILDDMLHNRSHFMTTGKNISDPYKPLESSEFGQYKGWIIDKLTYTFAYMLLAGVVLLVTFIVFYKWRVLRRNYDTKFHPPGKSHFAVEYH